MRIGRVSVTVMVCLMVRFSSSIGATMLLFPDSLRSFRALFCRMTGSYVSGIKIISGSVVTAKMSASQKVHLQLTTEIKPLMTGPTTGPTFVI